MMEIKFASREHKQFFFEMLERCKIKDSYHQAFFYCAGISDTTRLNINRMFSFEEDCIKPEALHDGWQTGGSIRLSRLAFNLWNGYTEEQYERFSTPYEMFDCSYAPYFLDAIRLKYPEYCRETVVTKPSLRIEER